MKVDADTVGVNDTPLKDSAPAESASTPSFDSALKNLFDAAQGDGKHESTVTVLLEIVSVMVGLAESKGKATNAEKISAAQKYLDDLTDAVGGLMDAIAPPGDDTESGLPKVVAGGESDLAGGKQSVSEFLDAHNKRMSDFENRAKMIDSYIPKGRLIN